MDNVFNKLISMVFIRFPNLEVLIKICFGIFHQLICCGLKKMPDIP